MGRAAATDDMTNGFLKEVVQLRGRIYEISELSASRYNKTITQATEKDEQTNIERFDNEKHQRILLSQCVRVGTKARKNAAGKIELVDGKPIEDIEDFLRESGNRVFREIVKRALNLHLDEEPEEEIVELVGETLEAANT